MPSNIPLLNPPSEIDAYVQFPEPSRRMRLLMALLLFMLVLSAVAYVWARWQRPWLIADYRAGYAQGVDAKSDAGRVNCEGLSAPHYRVWSPEQNAYVTGCRDGAAGLPNAWWHLADRVGHGFPD
ncbi:MAG: hypothetical protein ABI586_10575 [Candidatus Nanopelagicales bacterium]